MHTSLQNLQTSKEHCWFQMSNDLLALQRKSFHERFHGRMKSCSWFMNSCYGNNQSMPYSWGHESWSFPSLHIIWWSTEYSVII
jgi:hypothetical protein